MLTATNFRKRKSLLTTGSIQARKEESLSLTPARAHKGRRKNLSLRLGTKSITGLNPPDLKVINYRLEGSATEQAEVPGRSLFISIREA